MQTEIVSKVRYGLPMLIFGYVAGLGGPVFGIYFYFFSTQRYSSGFSILCLTVAFIAIGAWSVMEYHQNSHSCNNNGLTYSQLLDRDIDIQWEEIEHVNFSDESRSLLVSTYSGRLLPIRVVLGGGVEFYKQVLKKVPPERISAEAMKILAELANPERVWGK